MKKIRIDGGHFRDEQGRIVLLRGINLGGSSKMPATPDGATHIREGFLETRYDVSFVGRPFPLDEADRHFERLRAWGLMTLRFVVTWEAIEHAGPGQYDTDYLDYVQVLLQKAGDYGFLVIIDPHQDVWSRFTGGDGAPAWTLEKVGFDLAAIDITDAALVHQLHGDPLPRMTWPANYNKLAAGTMFALFFGGDDFAPQTQIDGVPAQEYLQSHFIGAMQQLVARLKDMPHVIGYDVMNEPSGGYIGWKDLTQLERLLKVGDTPTPFQAMLLGMGHAQSVGQYTLTAAGPKQIGTTVINPQGRRVWAEGYDCIWRQNGVWDYDANAIPRLLRPDHFSRVNGRLIDFTEHYLRPFFNRYAAALREIDPDAILFFQVDAIGDDVPPHWSDEDAPNIAYAPHQYDGLTLFTKSYTPWLAYDQYKRLPVVGRENVLRFLREVYGMHRQHADKYLGGVPVLIGEVGIPYDMNQHQAYYTGDYSAQIAAVDDYMHALEANLLHATIWNYTADNSNGRGDGWNGEDLSIFSPDQQSRPDHIHSGGRALEAVVRPYVRAVAGEPLRMAFDKDSGIFEFVFKHDKTLDASTEFFVPDYQYSEGYVVDVSDGEFEKVPETQTLIYRHSSKEMPHFIRVLPATPRPAKRQTDGRAVLLRVLTVLASIVFLRWLLRRR